MGKEAREADSIFLFNFPACTVFDSSVNMPSNETNMERGNKKKGIRFVLDGRGR